MSSVAIREVMSDSNDRGVGSMAGLTDNGRDVTGAVGLLKTIYYVTAMVATQIRAAVTDTWTLDPAWRLRRAVRNGWRS